MQESVYDQEPDSNISRHRSYFEIKTGDTGEDNGEDRDVSKNKRDLTDRVFQIPQQRQYSPFVIGYRVQFMREQHGQAQVEHGAF